MSPKRPSRSEKHPFWASLTLQKVPREAVFDAYSRFMGRKNALASLFFPSETWEGPYPLLARKNNSKVLDKAGLGSPNA